ncbi:hypothetical protein CGRA01v4_08282 [Colletotrichum graminicola]|nr:hypothetical protein CGRA01v4_08282 [Colletotrichum graminicola]
MLARRRTGLPSRRKLSRWAPRR